MKFGNALFALRDAYDLLSFATLWNVPASIVLGKHILLGAKPKLRLHPTMQCPCSDLKYVKASPLVLTSHAAALPALIL